jgi:hypothetical protein
VQTLIGARRAEMVSDMSEGISAARVAPVKDYCAKKVVPPTPGPMCAPSRNRRPLGLLYGAERALAALPDYVGSECPATFAER